MTVLNSIRVADYMTRRLISLSPTQTVNQAIKVLLENGISGAPVVDGGDLVGVFSESDCLKGAIQSGYHGTDIGTVAEFMSVAVETVDINDSILSVADLFLNQRRRRLPVLEDGKLVGQISRRDVLRAMNDFAQRSSVA